MVRSYEDTLYLDTSGSWDKIFWGFFTPEFCMYIREVNGLWCHFSALQILRMVFGHLYTFGPWNQWKLGSWTGLDA